MTADRTPPLPTEFQRTAPERIYLVGCDDMECEEDFKGHGGPNGEVTWCEDKAQDNSVEYIRADLPAPPAAPQTAWFVELQSDGVFKGWLSVDGDIECGWTTDPNRAIKFASKADADMARRRWKFLMDRHSTRHLSTEHIWLDAPAAPRSKPVDNSANTQGSPVDKSADSQGRAELCATAQAAPDDLAERLRSMRMFVPLKGARVFQLTDEPNPVAECAADELARLRAVEQLYEAGCKTWTPVLNAMQIRAERAEAELAALKPDAERWQTLCNLWMACTILTLTQDEDGRWSIEATEPVDYETFATLTGDDPDAAIDAARAAT